MTYLHGHGACINNQCPMFGLNQAECCDGETVSNCASPQKNEITLMLIYNNGYAMQWMFL